ncbi:MAG: hypothetical protein ACTSYB_16490 [Candidatus Helarchaeota archaeon]
MEILQCWKMHADLHVFIIPVRISNPETKLSIVKNCLFDTGFSGYIGLDHSTISMLQLPKMGTGRGLSIDRLVEIENFEGTAELIDANQASIATIKNIDTTNIQTHKTLIPIQSINIPIIGMRVITQFRWLILPDKELICLLK